MYRDGLFVSPVILANARIQIGCVNQASFYEGILDSSFRWNDGGEVLHYYGDNPVMPIPHTSHATQDWSPRSIPVSKRVSIP